MSDPISLILNSKGRVVSMALGRPEDIEPGEGQRVIIRDGDNAVAWRNWVLQDDGTWLTPLGEPYVAPDPETQPAG